MIVIDTSALVVLLEREPEYQAFKDTIAYADRRIVSAVIVYETAIVLLSRHGATALPDLWTLIEGLSLEVIAFDTDQARIAIETYGRFGKGFHSKARLNLCDCVSYALATTLNAPLLYKGNDFAATDIMTA
jgi:ribonuclease VapC